MERWIEKAKEDLEILIGNMATRDYLSANRLKNGKLRKKYVQYTLGRDTIEAKEKLHLIYEKESVSKEVEEEVKGYLLKYRLNNLKPF